MIFIVGVSLTMFSSSWLLHSGLLWHLLTIKKSLALLQIVTYGVMDFAPLLSISRSMERSFLFLFGGLLLAVPVIAVISMICCVDLPVFLLLLLLGPLVMWFKEPNSSLWDLNTDISDCQQIGHYFEFLHGDLLDSLNITDPITEGVDDFDVLDVGDMDPSVAETFHVLPETLIGILLDSLQRFSS
jgi:hypothetical protein